MPIIIDVRSGTVSVDGVSRAVVFPTDYLGLDTITYNTETAMGAGDMVGDFTMASILGLSLALWQAEEPTASDIWIQIKAKRSRMNAGGVFVSGDWYHTDSESVAQYSIMYASVAVNSLPSSYVFNTRWKTMDGDFRPMTVTLLKKIINTGMTVAAINFANAERHKAALMVNTSPLTYDYSSGWGPARP